MPSLFYPNNVLVLPFLFYEGLALHLEAQAEKGVDSEGGFSAAILQAYYVVYKKEPPEKDLVSIAERLVKEAQDLPSKEEKEKPRSTHPLMPPPEDEKKKKGFGGSFADWIQGLEPDQLCLLLAGFDREEARKLYCEVDRNEVLELASLRFGYLWERAYVQFEAVLFGMGGGYKGQAADPDVVNLSESTGTPAILEKLGLVMH